MLMHTRITKYSVSLLIIFLSFVVGFQNCSNTVTEFKHPSSASPPELNDETDSIIDLSEDVNPPVESTLLTLADQDPGPSMPLWKPRPNIYVFNRTFDNLETFVPRCIPTPYYDCQRGGSGSAYDTVKVGEIWAMRMYYTDEVGPNYISHSFVLARTETGEAYSNFEGAVSTEIGNFNVGPYCKGTHIDVINENMGAVKFGGFCRLKPHTRYYLNIRFKNEICGPAELGCRVRVALRPTYPFGE